MDRTEIKDKLCDVLKNIQAISGEECPPLDGALRPADSLSKFNSKVWPVAAGMLATAIGRPIPPEANIFVDRVSKEPLTIDQAVERVWKLLEKQQTEDTAA